MITTQFLVRWWLTSLMVIVSYFLYRKSKDTPLNWLDVLVYCAFMPGLLTILIGMIIWVAIRKLLGTWEDK